MPQYEVMRPWHGVRAGETFEADVLHPALASHVRVVPDDVRGELTPATPDAVAPKRGRPSKAENETE